MPLSSVNNFVKRYTAQFIQSSNNNILSPLVALLQHLKDKGECSTLKETILELTNNDTFLQNIVDTFWIDFETRGVVYTALLPIFKSILRTKNVPNLFHVFAKIASGNCTEKERSVLLDFSCAYVTHMSDTDLNSFIHVATIHTDCTETVVKIIHRYTTVYTPDDRENVEQFLLRSLNCKSVMHTLIALARFMPLSTLPLEQLIKPMLEAGLGSIHPRQALSAIQKLSHRKGFSEELCNVLDTFLHATIDHQIAALECVGRFYKLSEIVKYFDLVLDAVNGIAPFTLDQKCQKTACRVARLICGKIETFRDKAAEVLIPHLYNPLIASEVAVQLCPILRYNMNKVHLGRVCDILLELLPTCNDAATFKAFIGTLVFLFKSLPRDSLMRVANMTMKLFERSVGVPETNPNQPVVSVLSLTCSVCSVLEQEVLLEYTPLIYARAKIYLRQEHTIPEQDYDYDGYPSDPLLFMYRLLSILARKLTLTQEQMRQIDFIPEVIRLCEDETKQELCYEIISNVVKGPNSYQLLHDSFDALLTVIVAHLADIQTYGHLRKILCTILITITQRFGSRIRNYTKPIIDGMNMDQLDYRDLRILCALCVADFDTVTANAFDIENSDSKRFKAVFQEACKIHGSNEHELANLLCKIVQIPRSAPYIDGNAFIQFSELSFGRLIQEVEFYRMLGGAKLTITEVDQTIQFPSTTLFRCAKQMIRSSLIGRKLFITIQFRDVSFKCSK